MAVNIQLSLTPCTHETRLLKQVYSIQKTGLFSKILIFALQKDHLVEYQKIEDFGEIWRVPLITPKFTSNLFFQMMKYLEWTTRVLLRASKEPVQVVQCHSIATLPVGILIKILFGARLVYDAHELETETYGLKGIKQIALKTMEKIGIGFVDKLVVVSGSIANWYEQKYKGIEPIVVRNIPYRRVVSSQPDFDLRKKLGIPIGAVLFLYQGGMVRGRNIEKLLSVFKQVDQGRHILFLGSGPYTKEIETVAKENINIHYIPAVDVNILLEYTKQADVGICLTENNCLNHYYSLPNKIFEYIFAEIPVIINELIEQKKLVANYRCGWILEDENQLREVIEGISQEEVMEKKMNLRNRNISFSWEKEVEKFIEAYRELVKS